MFEQLATAGRGPALFDGFDEPGVVFQHPVHGFHDELCGLSAGSVGKVLEPGFLLGWQSDFHKVPFQFNAFSLGEAEDHDALLGFQSRFFQHSAQHFVA